jgi:hypothetical protein
MASWRTGSAGRGRSGGVWHSPPGAGLWISVLLPFHGVAPAHLPLVVGIAAPLLAIPLLLLWLRRGGEVRFEEVVGPECDKGILFLSISSSQHLTYSRGEIVIADACWHTFVPFERLALSLEERLLPLGGKCHHERPP